MTASPTEEQFRIAVELVRVSEENRSLTAENTRLNEDLADVARIAAERAATITEMQKVITPRLAEKDAEIDRLTEARDACATRMLGLTSATQDRDAPFGRETTRCGNDLELTDKVLARIGALVAGRSQVRDGVACVEAVLITNELTTLRLNARTETS